MELDNQYTLVLNTGTATIAVDESVAALAGLQVPVVHWRRMLFSTSPASAKTCP